MKSPNQPRSWNTHIDLTCVTVIFKLVFISKPSKHKNKAKRREHMAQVDFDLTFRSPLAVTFSPTTSFLRRQRQNFVRQES